MLADIRGTVAAMRRHLSLLLLLGLLTALLTTVTTQAPSASAATTCNDVKGDVGFGVTRFCQVNTNSRYNRGNTNANISWQYNDEESRGATQTGRFVGRLINYQAQGCSYLYFKHTTAPRGAELWVSACGKGARKGVDVNLNGTHNRTGYINIYQCYSRSTGSCSLIWQQNIAAHARR